MSRLRVLSLGAGVQSTTLALMAAAGEIEAPHDAIFADTGAEPAAVYRHLEWLMQPGLLPFPVHIVKWRNLANDVLDPPEDGFLSDTMVLPAHQKPSGQITRYCTSNYKTAPITKKINALRHGLHKVEEWIGISTDEADRMTTASEKWRTKRYPLIERGMSRTDCRSWLFKRGYPQPPKSSCVFCPYKGDGQWRDLHRDDREGWTLACEVDAAIRINFGIEAYVHRSLTPLVIAPLGYEQGDLFSNECKGYCGV
jgi:hypothetical protein